MEIEIEKNYRFRRLNLLIFYRKTISLFPLSPYPLYLHSMFPRRMLIKNIKITIDFNEVLKELGFKAMSSVLTPAIEKMIKEEIEKAEGLIHSQSISINFNLPSVTDDEVKLAPDRFNQGLVPECLPSNGSIGGFNQGTDCNSIVFKTKYLSKHLKGCSRASLFVCTIGPKLEEKVKNYFAEGEQTRAYLMNGIGSAAVEDAANYVNQVIIKEAEKEGFETAKRFSPGYGDWDLSDQKAVFDVLKPSAIGVELNEKCLMIPEKTITAIVGWKKI
ncbi:MAG: hypothetical protein HY097_08380 [Nitrospinae bacterium]|nr:hypothetical protein [Nitrospinota bacterium]